MDSCAALPGFASAPAGARPAGTPASSVVRSGAWSPARRTRTRALLRALTRLSRTNLERDTDVPPRRNLGARFVPIDSCPYHDSKPGARSEQGQCRTDSGSSWHSSPCSPSESGPNFVAFAITNRGEHPVPDVEALISHAFLWNDERNPGANNPGRASRVPIPDEIVPGETTRVSSPLVPPLPARTDGKFDVKSPSLDCHSANPPTQDLQWGAGGGREVALRRAPHAPASRAHDAPTPGRLPKAREGAGTRHA